MMKTLLLRLAFLLVVNGFNGSFTTTFQKFTNFFKGNGVVGKSITSGHSGNVPRHYHQRRVMTSKRS